MKTTLPLLAILVLASACRSGTESAPLPEGVNDVGHQDAPYVVMISFDGFRWDYQDRFATPNFDRVADAGVRAERMIPVFPSKTFPTHYSIATGMYAENHGLVGNRYWAPDKGGTYQMSDRAVVEDGSWYGGEPIWVTAERQGMVAASYFFVGSEADVGGVRPTYWHRFDGSVPNNDRVDAALEWLEMPPESRPHMITLYFSDVDDAGHQFGPDSEEVETAVASVDRSLGRFLDGLEQLPHGDDVHVVLVSDHGMMLASTEEVDILDMDLFPGVLLAEAGPYGSLHIQEGGAERGPGLRDSIQALMPLNQVYLREDVPERLHYSANPRVGDIVIVVAAGRTVSVPDRVPTRDYYTHGWDNATPEMGAIFLAKGSRIQPGTTVPGFESVHVYPFLAEILGLTPNPEMDGTLDVLSGVLTGG